MLLASAARSLVDPESKQGTWPLCRKLSQFPLTSSPAIALCASDWSRSAEHVVRALSSHLERIDEILSRYINLQDLGGDISIRGSKVIALVALAEIYHHLSRTPTFRQTPEKQPCCLTSIERAVAVVEDLRNENHLQKVHAYTGVSQNNYFTECGETQ